MEEQWKDIAGYEGLYQVSNLGRVRSLDREDSGGRKRKGRVLRAGNVCGYPFVNLSKNGQQHVVRVHRLVAEAFLGPCPEGLSVNHKDCDKANNRADNLEYITHSENIRHAAENGLLGKLTREQVQAIRYIYQRNRRFPVDLVANKFGVSEAVIKSVVGARAYTWIPNIDGTPVIPLEGDLSVEGLLVMRAAGFEAREISLALDVEYSAPFRTLNRAGIHLSRLAAD